MNSTFFSPNRDIPERRDPPDQNPHVGHGGRDAGIPPPHHRLPPLSESHAVQQDEHNQQWNHCALLLRAHLHPGHQPGRQPGNQFLPLLILSLCTRCIVDVLIFPPRRLLPVVFVHSHRHPAPLLLPVHLLLALPGGAARLPHDQRSARHQLWAHEILLPNWLGSACLHHRSELFSPLKNTTPQ